MKKRFLMRAQAVAMAVCLTVGTLNATAFAAQQTDSNQTQQTTEDNTAKDSENDTSGSGTSDSTTESKDNNEDKKDEGTGSDTGSNTDNESSGSESGDSTTDGTGGQENPDNGSTDTGTEGGSADNGSADTGSSDTGNGDAGSTDNGTTDSSTDTSGGSDDTKNEDNGSNTDNGTDNNLDDKNSTDSDDKVSDTDKTEKDSKTDDKDKDKKEEDKKEKKAKEEELPESGPTSYHSIDYDVKSVDGEGELTLYGANLSSSYDSRNSGCITSVKDQNPYGTCWAFSAMAASEAAIIKGGLADSSLDLSEFHTIYFTYNTAADPLGNTKGDRLSASSILDGGNNMFTTFSLATWAGAVNESKAPYSSLVSNSSAKLDSSLAYNDDYHLQNSYWINMLDRNDVKSAIVKYGAVAAAYMHDDAYLNAGSFAYCAPDSLKTGGHAITLIGWDDNYSKKNFNSNCQPSSNGAWLVKNSWDSWWGNDGYFWISYEDGNINKEPAIVFEYDSASNYDHNYQYDGTPGVMAYGVYNSGSIANVFTAKANSDGSEKLEAVSFAIADTNVKYSIQVYSNIKDSDDPTSGTKMLSTPQTGTTSYEGYYTVKLKNPVTIAEGSKFSVVISLSKSNSNTVYYFAEKSFDYDWIKGISSYNEGQSFTQMSSGQDWIDLASAGLTARVKAFTTDVEGVSPTKVKLNKSSLSLKAGDTAQLKAELTPGNTTFKDITWNSSKTSVATVDSKGKITAKGLGTATITATTYNGLSASCKVTVSIGKVSGLKAASQSTSQIKLQWNKQNGVSGYEIYRYDSSKKKYTKIKTITKASTATYTDKKKSSGTSYKYKVRAYKKNGSKKTYGSYSSVLTTATKTSKPVIRVTAGAKRATVKWSKIKGASGYEVYMSTKKSSGYTKVKTLTKSSKVSYTKSGLKKGKTYYFKVRTYKKAGDKKIYSSYSSVKSIKIKR